MSDRAPSSLALIADAPAYADRLAALRRAPRRWLVTGGAGFIGSHLTQALLELGQHVAVLDDLSTGRARHLRAVRRAVGPAAVRLRFVRGDVRDAEALALAADHVDVILHHAAATSGPDADVAPVESHEVDVGGFLQVLEVARTLGARVVYAASSVGAGGEEAGLERPGRPGRARAIDAASKIAGEAYAAAYRVAYGLETIGLRYADVFGDRQDPHGPCAAAIPAWIDATLQGRPCRIDGDGWAARDLCHVANVVGAVLAASLSEDPRVLGAALEVGSGVRTTPIELHDAIVAAVRARRPGTVRLPPDLGPGGPGDVRRRCADIAFARATLGYEPVVGLRDGIDATVAAVLDATPSAGPASGRAQPPAGHDRVRSQRR
jgi:UDP-N-acetylglucosamine 4-epimerase